MLREFIKEQTTVLKTYIDSRITECIVSQKRTNEELVELRAVHQLSNKKDSVKQHAIDVPFFDVAFSDDVIQVVIEKCTIRHVTTTVTEYQTKKELRKTDKCVLARGAALALRIMLFSVNQKKKESRKMYSTELGRKFSEFREGIVLTALKAAKQNKFHLFRDSDKSDCNDVEQKDINSSKARIPAWLNNDFITEDHITSARIRTEERADTGKGSDAKMVARVDKFVGDGDANNELATYAATQLYKRFTGKLTSARMMAKSAFFDEIGYLFVDWEEFSCNADQSQLKIQWRAPDDISNIPDIHSIPDATPSYTTKNPVGSDEHALASVHKKNRDILRELMTKCSGMELEIEHEVCIRKHAKKGDKGVKRELELNDMDTDNSTVDSASKTDKKLDDEQVLRKDVLVFNVSLIEISCRLLCGYTSQLQYTPPASFLCASTDSVRCIFSVSLLLKELLDKVIRDDSSFDMDARVNGISLDAFLPTPARQRNGLRTKCVYMYESLFLSRSARNKAGTSEPSHATSSSDMQRDVDRKTTIIEIN